MTAVKKFTFDVSFDPEHLNAALADAKSAEAEAEAAADEQEIEVPTFSEEELEQARQEGFQRGHAEATREQATAIERQTMDLLGVLGERIQTLFKTEEDANEARSREAVAAALSIVRKLFPHLSGEAAQKEVETLVLHAMAELREESKITITLHPDMVGLMKDRIADLASEGSFRGTIEFHSDETMDRSDCRVTWGLGGIERSTAELWQKIDEIIEENLGADVPLSTDPVETPEVMVEAAPDMTTETTTDNNMKDDIGTVSEAVSDDGGASAPDMTSDQGDDHG